MRIPVYGFLLVCLVSAGCAQLCEFGKGDNSSGLKCYRVFNKAEVGMTAKEVQDRIGTPQSRSIDVSYNGKTYDEVWIYGTTPPTVLYFKNGIVAHKEYQQ